MQDLNLDRITFTLRNSPGSKSMIWRAKIYTLNYEKAHYQDRRTEVQNATHNLHGH